MGKETFAEYAKTNRPNSSKLAMKKANVFTPSLQNIK